MDFRNLESVRLAWRDDDDDAVRGLSNEDEKASAASTSTDVETVNENGFIVHKIAKMDTLAGLAVRFHVSLADLKRFNGILSDIDLYGRDTLFVPTKSFPVGEEVQRMFAQIACGIGRDLVLNSTFPMQAAASASTATGHARLNLNLPYGQVGPPDDSVEVSWWDRWGACTEGSEVGRWRQRRSSDSEPGHVELMERRAMDGPTQINEQMRRRRQTSYEAESESSGRQFDPHEHEGRPGEEGRGGCSWREGEGGATVSAGAAASGFFSNLGRAIGDSGSALVHSIRKVTSQPAMAGPRGAAGSRGRNDVADGVLSSLRHGLLPMGNLRQERPLRKPAAVSQAMTNLSSKPKAGSKSD